MLKWYSIIVSPMQVFIAILTCLKYRLWKIFLLFSSLLATAIPYICISIQEKVDLCITERHTHTWKRLTSILAVNMTSSYHWLTYTRIYLHYQQTHIALPHLSMWTNCTCVLWNGVYIPERERSQHEVAYEQRTVQDDSLSSPERERERVRERIWEE